LILIKTKLGKFREIKETLKNSIFVLMSYENYNP